MAAILFIKKWKAIEPSFADYFQKQWLDKNENWYEGAVERSPSTNHGLESFNNVIKKEATFRKQLTLVDFTRALKKLTEDCSKDYNRHIVTMSTEPNLSRKRYHVADEWLNLFAEKVAEKEIDEDNKIVYCVKSTKNRLKKGGVMSFDEIQNKRWRSFDQYIKYGFGMYYTTILHRNDWKTKSKCMCPDFLKNYICKHIIGLAIKEKLTECPGNALSVPLAQNRKRGRPALAKKALIVE